MAIGSTPRYSQINPSMRNVPSVLIRAIESAALAMASVGLPAPSAVGPGRLNAVTAAARASADSIAGHAAGRASVGIAEAAGS